ncbi:MAG: MFS transporter [Bacilli bacterium]|nr:MFS transporter [Bacilli bacterium]MDD4077262.1 MFS transporter [Bacilli bacterium]MDD4388324.1 MFS transporter [Bacilli bacterium]
MSGNVLKNKNFLLLFIGALCSNIGQVFYTFSVGLYVLDISDSPFIHGVYLATSGLVFLLATPIGGFLADRLNKARIVYLTDYIRGGIIIVSGYFLFSYHNLTVQLVVLFVTAFLLNVLSAIFNPAASSLVRFIVEEEQLQQAQSYYGILNSIQQIIGIILAGILFSFLKIAVLFVLVGALYILSGFSEMFIRYQYQKKEDALTFNTMVKDYGEGLRYLQGQKALLLVVFGILFINFFIVPIFNNGTTNFVTYYLIDDYLFSESITPKLWAALFSCFLSVGSLISAFVLSITKDRGNYGNRLKRWLFVLALIIAAIPISFYFLVIIFNRLNLYLLTFSAIMFFIGIVVVCINTPAGVAIQKIVEKDKLAKVQSLLTIGSMGLTPFASFLGGAVISKFGLGPLFIVCAGGILITSIIIGLSKQISTLGAGVNNGEENIAEME